MLSGPELGVTNFRPSLLAHTMLQRSHQVKNMTQSKMLADVPPNPTTNSFQIFPRQPCIPQVRCQPLLIACLCQSYDFCKYPVSTLLYSVSTLFVSEGSTLLEKYPPFGNSNSPGVIQLLHVSLLAAEYQNVFFFSDNSMLTISSSFCKTSFRQLRINVVSISNNDMKSFIGSSLCKVSGLTFFADSSSKTFSTSGVINSVRL
mmetsp:Transcript_10630/g.12145  ORF Transcript_10630/g.12145 Transcript_10630/m.12145 type:complete len:203 (-) Transcript_10630:516-1124(-)